jgi:hypothetical protein
MIEQGADTREIDDNNLTDPHGHERRDGRQRARDRK